MPKETIQTKEQQAIVSLAYLVDELANLIEEVGGPSFAVQAEQIKKQAWRIIKEQ